MNDSHDELAVAASLAEHRPSLALARLARAAWSLALHEGAAAEADGASTTMASGRGGP